MTTLPKSTQAVLDLLRAHPEGVTPLLALDEAGSFRLGARVFDLRALGYVISKEMVTLRSGKRVAKYKLHEKPQLELGIGA